MTCAALTALLVASVAGALDLTDLCQEIDRHQYRRIVVCPRAVIQNAQGTTAVDEIAMMATEQLQQIGQQLLLEGQGRFSVVDADAAAAAVKGLTLSELANPDVRRNIGLQTGSDAMYLMTVHQIPEDGQWELRWNLVALDGGTVAVQGTETFDLILSDAAYMGQSFELRRWGPGGLEVVGFDPKLPRDWAMGVGAEWERLQYAGLLSNPPHPLENPQIPYGIQLVVNGQPLLPERICDQLYVAVDPSAGPAGGGPEIGIRMFNRSGHQVFMGVYIDGVNMINQVRELPLTTPTARHWSVRDGYDSVIRNWYYLDRGRVEQRAAFQLVDASRSVAARQGLPNGSENEVAFGERIDDRLGMITCIVYTHGWDGVDANSSPPPQRGIRPRFAIGQGQIENTQVRWVPGERGIMLAAMTLHYRTPDELARIRSAGCEQLAGTDPTDGVRAGEGDNLRPGQAQPAPPNSSPDGAQPPARASEPNIPGEDAAFPPAG